MFSVEQKREIAAAIQAILRSTEHPELPKGEIQFQLHVDGAERWSWADIKNNGAVENPTVNPFNEQQALNPQEYTLVKRQDIERLLRLIRDICTHGEYISAEKLGEAMQPFQEIR